MDDAPATPLNRAVLDTLQELGGEALVVELIERFELVIEERMPALRGAAAGNDLIGVERVAHALRSSAATLGAGGLAEQLTLLEESAASGQLDAIGAGLGRVSAELVPARAALANVAGELRAQLSRRPTR